jgi:hypothetical protein
MGVGGGAFVNEISKWWTKEAPKIIKKEIQWGSEYRMPEIWIHQISEQGHVWFLNKYLPRDQQFLFGFQMVGTTRPDHSKTGLHKTTISLRISDAPFFFCLVFG